MVVNFRVCEISRGARKLTRTPKLNLKKKNCVRASIRSQEFSLVRESYQDTCISKNKN
jgi:hypothetical protein